MTNWQVEGISIHSTIKVRNIYTGCPKKKFPTKNAHFKGFRVILEQNVRE